MNRPTRSKLSERRRGVANLALKGWTQAAIARHMHLPPATVCRDLAAMREFWREFPVYDCDRVRLEQLQKIDLVEAETWAAWQRSPEPQRSAWINSLSVEGHRYLHIVSVKPSGTKFSGNQR